MIAVSRRTILKTAAATPALTIPGAFAQADYPSRPITAVAMFAPGTGADTLVRFYAQRLQETTGKTVLVENKVGQGGNIATEYVARSRPDGYTIYVAPSTSVLSSAVSLYKKLPYDPINDFEHITTIARVAFILIVPSNAPYKTVAELTEHLTKKGDKAAFSASTHTGKIASELYKQQYGLKAIEVGYKSGLDALNDLKAGSLDFIFTDAGTVRGQIDPGGQFRAISTASADGIKALPFVPSARSQGLDMDLVGYWGLHTSKGTPAPVVEWLAKHVGAITRSQEAKDFLARFGWDNWEGDGALLKETVIKQADYWARYVKIAGIEPQ
jgi:tripartite-type tricarboxylate transporter receptor subunit TctC